jgi:hypothetical protein
MQAAREPDEPRAVADWTLNKLSVIDRTVNLAVSQLKAAIRELLRDRGIEGSVVDKVNTHGELVIAVVLNEKCPACGGTGKRVYVKDAKADV